MLARSKFEIADLVNKMLDEFPASTWASDTETFCDPAMGGGQFLKEVVRKLRAAGHSDSNIRQRVFGYESNELLLNYAINKPENELVGTFEVKSMKELQSMEKKFDVIVGNPPYQKTFNGSRKAKKYNLWSEFVRKSFELSDGYVALIIPDGWMSYSSDIGTMILSKDLLRLNVGECSRYFSGGVRTTYFVAKNKNSEKNRETEIVTDKEIFKMKLYGYSFLPAQLDPTIMTILKKTHNIGSAFEIERGIGYHTSHTHLFGEGKSFPYPVHHTNPQLKHSSQKSGQFSESKVLWTLSGYYMPVYDFTGNIGASQATAVCKIPKKNMKFAKFVFDSKLFKFLIRNAGTQAGWISLEFCKALPKLPLTKEWTDAQIYKHFNITKKEQAHIESYIK